MTRRLASLALGLYPLAFRRRYGEEMRALLEETESRPRQLFDLLRGALVAHVRPPAGLAEVLTLDDRIRASAGGVLACWVAFAAAGFGFYKTTEDHPFETAGIAHPLLGGAHFTVQVLALVGSIAVLLGALPLIVTALVQARREPRLLVLVSLPIAAMVAFAGLTGLLVWMAHGRPHSPHASPAGRGMFIAWELAGLVCGAVCVVVARRVLFAVPVTRARLQGALACGTVVTATMTAMALAVAVYTVGLPLVSSGLANTPNGPLGFTPTGVSLLEQLAVMTLAGVLAVITTRRGWRAAGAAHASEPA
jgi:hypothetical protein